MDNPIDAEHETITKMHTFLPRKSKINSKQMTHSVNMLQIYVIALTISYQLLLVDI